MSSSGNNFPSSQNHLVMFELSLARRTQFVALEIQEKTNEQVALLAEQLKNEIKKNEELEGVVATYKQIFALIAPSLQPLVNQETDNLRHGIKRPREDSAVSFGFSPLSTSSSSGASAAQPIKVATSPLHSGAGSGSSSGASLLRAAKRIKVTATSSHSGAGSGSSSEFSPSPAASSGDVPLRFSGSTEQVFSGASSALPTAAGAELAHQVLPDSATFNVQSDQNLIVGMPPLAVGMLPPLPPVSLGGMFRRAAVPMSFQGQQRPAEQAQFGPGS